MAGVSSLLLFLQVVGLWYVFHWASTHAAVITPADIMFTLSAAIVPALLLAVCVGVLIAGMSPPPATQADEHQGAALANRLSYYEDLVRLMTQHQPGRMSLVDAEGRFHFVSAETAKILQRDANDLVGRDVEKVFGPREGLKLKMQMDQVRMTGKPLEQIEHGRGQQSGLFIRTQLIPITVAGQLSGGVMIYQDDVTSLMVAQERRERMFRQLMDTLVAVVDRRDPYAAGHSARVGQIARAIAEEMDLSENDVETVEIAGTLMN
ncbi:MAG: hypothetical protein EBZ69_04040, partial [Alphaproteobacteria bacterium]|nr:hypothetical protein [Alphaproteobacteria bacterium]